MKLTSKEILTKFNDEYISEFNDFFSLKILLDNCILSSEYVLDKKYNELIVLSDKGNEIFEKALENNISKNNPEYIKMVLFLIFNGESLFVDIDKTDIKKIENIIHNEIINNK